MSLPLGTRVRVKEESSLPDTMSGYEGVVIPFPGNFKPMSLKEVKEVGLTQFFGDVYVGFSEDPDDAELFCEEELEVP